MNIPSCFQYYEYTITSTHTKKKVRLMITSCVTSIIICTGFCFACVSGGHSHDILYKNICQAKESDTDEGKAETLIVFASRKKSLNQLDWNTVCGIIFRRRTA